MAELIPDGQAIRDRRVDRDLTQDQLAQLANLSRSFLRELERGTPAPTSRWRGTVGRLTVARLAKALDCSIDDISRQAPRANGTAA